MSSNFGIGDIATIIVSVEDNESFFVHTSDIEYNKEQNNPLTYIETLIVGKSIFKDAETEYDGLIAFVICEDNKYQSLFSHLNSREITNYITNLNIDERNYEWLNPLSYYLNKYGKWLSHGYIYDAKKPRKNASQDSCRCRVCRNFIYMAAPDNQNDGMMTCNSCVSNPMRAYY